jgi:hypothetical protein
MRFFTFRLSIHWLLRICPLYCVFCLSDFNSIFDYEIHFRGNRKGEDLHDCYRHQGREWRGPGLHEPTILFFRIEYYVLWPLYRHNSRRKDPYKIFIDLWKRGVEERIDEKNNAIEFYVTSYLKPV